MLSDGFAGPESPFAVEAGETVDLTGVIRANAAVTDLGAPESDAAQIAARDAHLQVDYTGLSIQGR